MNLPAIIIVAVLFVLAAGLMIYRIREFKRKRRRRGLWE